jgi:DNA repair protein RadD
MSTPITLRENQHAAIARIRQSFAQGHRAPLLCAPCGFGKTRVFAHICAAAAAKGNRVLLLAHRVELVQQISEALSDEGCAHGYIAGGYGWSAGASVHVASVFSMPSRLEAVNPDLVIVDEAHHAVADTVWGRVLAAYPRAKVLGVTATPCRLSGQGLDDVFDDLIEGPSYDELIEQGFLTPVKVYAPPTVDATGLRTRAGDYQAREVIDLVDQPRITGDCIAHYRRIAPGARAVVFDVSVEAAGRRAAAFRDAGFTAAAIDGKTDRAVRALAVRDFREGRLQVLVSCDLISEGFDLPAIEVGICLRPTQSLSLWLQQSGRVLRPFPGKTHAILFDHAGNTLRHGLPTERRAWSLAGITETLKRAQPRAGLRTCPACFAVSISGSTFCRSCGKPFPAVPRKVEEQKGDLEEVTAETLAAKRRAKERQGARTLESLIAIGRIRGYASPERWAHAVMSARMKKARIG